SLAHKRKVIMNSQKKSGKFQLRLTETLKEEVVKLAKEDGMSQNAILNQAIAWYVKAREKNFA
ncbi:toxin-antitoxin system HicB family antitoxin, partial [Morganella morganii]